MFCYAANAGLKILELTHNQIHTLPDDIGDLRHLECLYVRHNKLTNLPQLDNCTTLKVSLHFSVLVCMMMLEIIRGSISDCIRLAPCVVPVYLNTGRTNLFFCGFWQFTLV